MGKKLVLIDGNSIASRAFYALPLLSNKQGIFTNAAYGFTQIILRVIDEINPDYLLVAFDAGKVTFRHTDFKEYKGKRKKTPSELSGQFPIMKELLDAFDIKRFELDGYEADDIIGTISKEAEAQEIETIIYTGDKDMLQLASDQVKIFLTRKGITEVDEYSPKEIKQKYDLSPDQIIDLKGLMGDASDNIPGVPGVGEKTALKLLSEYHTVEAVLENIDAISGKKLKENLETYKEQAILSKQLATIYRAVPMEVTLNAAEFKGYDKEKIYEVFAKLEFQSLIDRLGLTNGSGAVEQEEVEVNYDEYNEDFKEKWNSILKTSDPIALHIENFLTKENVLELLGLSITKGNDTLFLTLDQLNEWPEFITWLKDEKAPKWVYDGKGTDVHMHWKDHKVNGITEDIMLGAYLLNPSDGAVDLSEIAIQYGHSIRSDESIYGKGAKRQKPPQEELQLHISSKSHAIYNLMPKIQKKLEETKLEQLFHNIEMPLSKILAEMEKVGVSINKERLHQMGEEINIKLEELKNKIYEHAGVSFNINSPKQLGEILFDKLQLPVIKKTKTGYSTSADVLEKLEGKHPIIEYILHYRQLGKLQSTYIEGLLKVINKHTGKIHTSFNQAITATGRLSSTDPNLQNIPIRLEEGRKLRQSFKPSQKDWMMMAADYSQIELRVLAHIAQDENLIKAFKEDMDVHTKTAMDVFGVEADEVTSLMRRQAKAVNFGIVYGISDYGLSQNLHISRNEAGEFIDKYFSVFSGVKNYMETIVKQAKKDGYVKTLLNRRRYLPEINSSNFNIRSFAERTAMNTPIQGTAADIIKIAMIKVYHEMQKKKVKSRMLLQVHDELIFEVSPDEINLMKDLVNQTMVNAIELDIPLKVDVNVGPTWYEAK